MLFTGGHFPIRKRKIPDSPSEGVGTCVEVYVSVRTLTTRLATRSVSISSSSHLLTTWELFLSVPSYLYEY